MIATTSTLLSALLQFSGAGTSILPTDSLGSQYFGNDKQWYEDNIPFFECSNKALQDVYYYRWASYKSHIRNEGSYYIVTEFLNEMSWDVKPYAALQDATGHHIYEGRWLRNQRYLNDYINFMNTNGFRVYAYSENIADATWNRYLVNMDASFVKSQLSNMENLYGQWVGSKFDATHGLFHQTPISDATEYSIASIDASGGTDGFQGGESFRPSINSYQYGNALAISNTARLTGDSTNMKSYASKAAALKQNLQNSLWNTTLQHFVDRYDVTNSYVTTWAYIRGRELVGYVPWAFEMPDNNATYNAAWQHLMDPTEFYGIDGVRTVEPSYQYYMKQYRYGGTLPECQWNGPSWPFQETFVLQGMANLLADYTQTWVTRDDYMSVLKKYAAQHYFTDGSFNLVEDYYPDKAAPAPLVDFAERSQHYNHSQFDNLIITGLCGIRPSEGNMLAVNPMAPAWSASDTNSLSYFALENVLYHGHDLTIVYDATGSRYGQGKGLSVWVDGIKKVDAVPMGGQSVDIGPPVQVPVSSPVNLALSLTDTTTYPKPSASYTNGTGNLHDAIDGRTWYWTNTVNRWSCLGSNNAQDWYQVDFGSTKTFDNAKLSFFENGNLKAPADYKIQVSSNGSTWTDAPSQVKAFPTPLGNTTNLVTFPAQSARYVRALFTNKGGGNYTSLTEFEVSNENLGTLGTSPRPAPLVKNTSIRCSTGMLSIDGVESGTLQIVDGAGRSRLVPFSGGKAELRGLATGLYRIRVLGGQGDGFQTVPVLR